MSKRPTPETDATAAHEGNWDTKALRMTAHARKLEQERDEAREAADKWRKLHDTKDELFKKGIAEVERERDKAREDATNYYARIGELEKERDEARELVKAYQDYTQLLGDEISDMASVAYVHGWRSNRYEQGKRLREKIKQLEEAK